MKAGFHTDTTAVHWVWLGELKSLSLFTLSHLPSHNMSLRPYINCFDLLVITEGKEHTSCKEQQQKLLGWGTILE